jgi:xanthine dehydrogenase YagR molybdenum-binding subunit
VTTIVEHMGGGFGAKFGLGVAGLAACKLARQLGRPIHLMLTRADEFVMGGNRSASRQVLKGGVDKQGKLVALVADIEKFGGVGDGSFPARRPYIYEVGSFFLQSTAVYTHTDASVAMRAPGHPQASFGIESLIDELAYAVGVDPLTLRKQNLAHPAYARQLDAVASAIGWHAHPNQRTPGVANGGLNVGIGFGVATWGGGGSPRCQVDVKIEKDGSVSASVASQDLGTGTRTYVAGIVAEELGLELGQVVARIGNSRYGAGSPSGGSTTTASLAPAVKDAAFKARGLLAAKVAPVLGVPVELVRFEGGQVFAQDDRKRALSFAKACALLGGEGLTARGTWQSSLAGNGVHGAQAAKVRVDTLTGEVVVLEMAGMQDCGLVLNRAAVKSQLNGGMIQALGYGLFEERVIDPVLGVALNANLEDYKLPGTLEIPAMQALIDDGDDRRVVIGMAEPAIIPGHGAIANAVFNACGARVRSLPITPDKVLAALGKTA